MSYIVSSRGSMLCFLSIAKMPPLRLKEIEKLPFIIFGYSVKRIKLVGILLVFLLFNCQAFASEVFVGPFPSWHDLKKNYGAIGNGISDDTNAFQKGLDNLVEHKKHCVLFVPKGTYRITKSLVTKRKSHLDCMGVSIVGEDPESTILLWDGPFDGTVLHWDAWFSKVSRITIDGNNRAENGLYYGPAFSTYNETSDIIFKNLKKGVVLGDSKGFGQAENEILRCKFIKCCFGVITQNWNSADIWVWYCYFEDCDWGVFNSKGNWHVWESHFYRSKKSDLCIKNLMVFSVVNNVSVNSNCFFDFNQDGSWGSPTSFTGNRIIGTQGDWSALLSNTGPYLVIDNSFVSSGKSKAIRMTWADQILVGNKYDKNESTGVRGRYRKINEIIIDPSDFKKLESVQALPGVPKRNNSAVFEVSPLADGEEIQSLIYKAIQSGESNPVLHFPKGNFKIRHTLKVPKGSDLIITGDGAAETATQLEWVGALGGVVFRFEGPTHVTIKDLSINAKLGKALVVENCDQDGGQIFTDQLNASGPEGQKYGVTTAVRIKGLKKTDVLMRALQGSGNGGNWVNVSGDKTGKISGNQISIFTGAASSAVGQYVVSKGGKLVVRGVYHEKSSNSLVAIKLEGKGVLSIDATRFSYVTESQKPSIEFTDFQGEFTLGSSMMLPVGTVYPMKIEVNGNGSQSKVLILGTQFWLSDSSSIQTIWKNIATPNGNGGLIGSNICTNNKDVSVHFNLFLNSLGDISGQKVSRFNIETREDKEGVSDQTILDHLRPIRDSRVWEPAKPLTDVSQIKIHRVLAKGDVGGIVEFRVNE